MVLISNTLNCVGLSVAPTVLRIKQALTGMAEKSLPLKILVDEHFDHQRLSDSLGSQAGHVELVAHSRQMNLQPTHGQPSHLVTAAESAPGLPKEVLVG